MPSMQLPPLRHDDNKQSLTFVSHKVPANPAGHTQENDVVVGMQLPPFMQPTTEQRALVSQIEPINPLGQVQVNVLMPSTQVPPFLQG